MVLSFVKWTKSYCEEPDGKEKPRLDHRHFMDSEDNLVPWNHLHVHIPQKVFRYNQDIYNTLNTTSLVPVLVYMEIIVFGVIWGVFIPKW